jgi:hypothetical protein
MEKLFLDLDKYLIPVGERMPEYLADIIGYSDITGEIDTGYVTTLDGEDGEWGDFDFTVTHWCYVIFPMRLADD